MTGGFIPIPRELFSDDSWLATLPADYRWGFLYLLARARWKREPHQWWSGRGFIAVGFGECVISYRSLAKTLGMSKSSVYRMIQVCSKSGTLAVRGAGHEFSIVTITNYESYVVSQNESGTRSDEKRDTSGTRAGQEEESNQVISKKTTTPRAARVVYSERFEAFWTLYPRKTGKGAALAAWQKSGAESLNGAIEAALSWQAVSPQWLRDSGQWIPYPSTYLNQRRWEDQPASPLTLSAPRDLMQVEIEAKMRRLLEKEPHHA